jgi:carbamate kinase
MDAVRTTSAAIADLIEDGHEVVLTHGNGPQVGMIQDAFAEYHEARPGSDLMPMSMCVAMSQGYIGYDLQNQIGEELDRRGVPVHVATVLTQVVVDPEDPAFRHPTKPIGAFYTEEQARVLEREKGYAMREDSGRGWRRVVASPMPRKIVEIGAVRLLWDHAIVITCGGGGIPVVEHPDGTLEGVAAVIDKDFAAELLAEEVNADALLILTEVEKVAIRFGKPDQQDLGHLSLAEAARYVKEGQFGVGSMLPKVEAAMKFVRANPGKKAIITSLEKCLEALDGKTGTVITFA